MRIHCARLVVAASAGVVVLVLAACGGSTSADAGPLRTDGASSPTATVEAQRGREYRTLRELDDRAAIVVVATAGAPRADDFDPADANDIARIQTVTTMKVDRVLRGAYALPTLEVHTLGSAQVVVEDGAPTIQQDKQYLLWLKADRDPGARASSFYVVGDGVGMFSVLDGTATKLDKGSPDLVDRVTLAEVVAAEDARAAR